MAAFCDGVYDIPDLSFHCAKFFLFCANLFFDLVGLSATLLFPFFVDGCHAFRVGKCGLDRIQYARFDVFQGNVWQVAPFGALFCVADVAPVARPFS